MTRYSIVVAILTVASLLSATRSEAEQPIQLWVRYDPSEIKDGWVGTEHQDLVAEFAKKANEVFWTSQFKPSPTIPARTAYQMLLEFTETGDGTADAHLRLLPPMPPTGAPIGNAWVDWNLFTGFRPDRQTIGRQIKSRLFSDPETSTKIQKFLQATPDQNGQLLSDATNTPSYPKKSRTFEYTIRLPDISGRIGTFYAGAKVVVAPTKPATPPRSIHQVRGSNEVSLREMLPASGKEWRAVVNREVEDGHLDRSQSLGVCFKVGNDSADSENLPSIRFDCGSGDCAIDWSKTNEKVFENCPTQRASSQEPWSFISAANAAPTERVWNVPTAKTLERQLSNPERRVAGQGFTVFRIESAGQLKQKVDSVVYSITANKKPVRIGGFSPEEIPVSILPNGRLWIEFAMQNLDFTGHDMGCDTIEVELDFKRHGKTIGNPIVIKRSYIALRNAERTQHETNVGKLIWEGTYRQGVLRDEVAVEAFIGSPAFKVNADIAADRTLLGDKLWSVRANKRENITFLKKWFDRMAFTYNYKGQDRRLTLVIRPPLSKKPVKNNRVRMSYGLAVGVRLLPSHQVQFTFREDEVRKIREKMLAYRTETATIAATGPKLTKRAKRLADWFDRLNLKDDLPGYAYHVKGNPTVNPPRLCQFMGDAG